jgi:hypothetical protein
MRIAQAVTAITPAVVQAQHHRYHLAHHLVTEDQEIIKTIKIPVEVVERERT